jgi:predicted nucleic acid-binding protein
LTVFVDTSALFALLDADDAHHPEAATYFAELDPVEDLVTHSYVLVETTALTQARIGLAAVRALADELTPRLEVHWVDEHVHRAALTALLASTERRVSLVDRVSFEVMRARGITRAFAFDPDFARQGFATVP